MRRAIVLLMLIVCLSVGTSYSQVMQCALVEIPTVDPAPLNGHYYDDQTVTFCYSLQGYAQWGSNWLCGFELKFGPGWDTSTFQSIDYPGSCDGFGGWGYFKSCHSTGTSENFGMGYYYDRSSSSVPGRPGDGIPGNNLGDYTVSGSCVWNLCFSIKVKYACKGEDLSMTVTAMGDGTCGSWDNQGQYCSGIPFSMLPPGITCIPDCSTLKDTLTSTKTACAVNNGIAFQNVSGAYPPYSYNWSNGQNTGTIYGLGIGNYCVTTTDVNGCSISRCVTVEEDNNLKLTTASHDVSCFGNCDGEAKVDVAGGSGTYNYLWLPQQPSVPDITGICAGTYNLTVTDVNSSCKRTASYQVNQFVSLQANTTVSPIKCHGDCNGAISVTPTNGFPPFTYQWSNSSADSAISNLCAGIYNVTVADANGCSLDIASNLVEPLTIALNEKIRDVSCYGFANGSITILPGNGVRPYNVNWNSGATIDSIDHLATGAYYVTVTDANNCEIKRSFFITQPPVLGDQMVTHPTSCPDATNGSLEINVYGGTIPYTYLWSTLPPQTNSIATDLAPGTYTAYVKDQMGCKIVDTATVGALPLFTVTASPDQEMKMYSSVDLSFKVSRKGNYQIVWSPNQSLNNANYEFPVASPTITTTYVVTVIEPTSGCRASDSTVVVVLPTDFLFVPNAFSPNGDGNNDFFYPLKGELVTVTEFRIFDRWGNQVFNDAEGKWNGKSRSGVDMPVAAYAWYVEYTIVGDGQTYKQKGNVTLVR